MARSMTGIRAKGFAMFILVAFVAVSVSAKKYSPPPPHKSHHPHHKRHPPPPRKASHPPPPKSHPPPPKSHPPPPKDGYRTPPYGTKGNYTGHGLKYNFYGKTCPKAESIITAAVKDAYNKDNSIPAGLIRLFFHDCFVRGCDASVFLDGPDTERNGAPNLNSLRGFEVIDAAKANIEKVCPHTVSCADVIGYAARDSIVLAGGVIPYGLWLGGRKDGFLSVSSDSLTELPSPFLDYQGLVDAFKKKGLTESEMVILSAGHTLGHSHCGTILARLYNFHGTGLPDPAIDPSYLKVLQGKCPKTAPGDLVDMDQKTPNKIDTNYIDDVLNGRGMFESDNALRTTDSGVKLLKQIDKQNVFGPEFTLAMLKMGTIGVLQGSAGNIRVDCSTTVGAFPGN